MTTQLDLAAITIIGRRNIELDANAPELVAHLTFSDRESYLAWVTAWKAAYHETSIRIRSRKTDVRVAGSNVPSQLRYELFCARARARALLALRAAGKRASWAMAQAARAARGEGSAA